MRNNKRGLSEVVVSVLLVVLAIAAIVIVWTAIKPLLKSSSNVETSSLTLDVQIQKAQVQGKDLTLQVNRKSGSGSLSGLKIVINNKTGSETLTYPTELKELETKTFTLNFSITNPTNVEVYPILNINGEEKVGSILDKSDIKTGVSAPSASCNSGDGCKSSGCATGDLDCTCDNELGDVCLANEECKGTLLKSSDSASCCNEICTLITCPNNICDSNENCPADVGSCTSPPECKLATGATCTNGCVYPNNKPSGTLCTGGLCDGNGNCNVYDLNLGLVSYYKFENNLVDSKSGFNGLPSSLLYYTTGIDGQAGSFNGWDRSVEISDRNELDFSNAITISMWINPAAYNPNHAAHLIGKAGDTTVTTDANFVWYFFGNSFGKNIGVYATAGGAWKSVSGLSSVLSLNRWYHITWTYDSFKGGQLYVDGVPIGSLTGSGALTTNNYLLHIGHVWPGGGTGGDFFNGLIDNVRIYNRALTANEVLYMNNTKG